MAPVWLVTGCSTGFGRELVRAALGHGFRVVATARDPGTLEEFATHPDVLVAALDVTVPQQIADVVRQAETRFGRIDVLVANAGIRVFGTVLEATEEDWDRLMGINAKSQYFLMQAVCPVMKRQGGGRIVNVASSSGRTGAIVNASIYSGTKGGIVMFSKSIAREVAADNILINCVAPGVLDTEIMRNFPPEKVRAIADQIPLKRLGKPAEVAALIAFLASDECSYCTGATFDINGGWFML